MVFAKYFYAKDSHRDHVKNVKVYVAFLLKYLFFSFVERAITRQLLLSTSNTDANIINMYFTYIQSFTFQMKITKSLKF